MVNFVPVMPGGPLLSLPIFGRSVNHIPTREADSAHPKLLVVVNYKISKCWGETLLTVKVQL